MATIAGHLSIDALRERYVSSFACAPGAAFPDDLAAGQGHSVAEVSRMTSFGPRWIEQLAARYNAGPDSLGDLRRRNGTSATILKPETARQTARAFAGAAQRRRRVDEPKDRRLDAQELGLAKVCPQRGWEALKALGWSIQAPRRKIQSRRRPKKKRR